MAKNQNNNVAPATQKTEPEAKKDALATALAQIEKQFGKGAVMKLGDNASMQVDAISTGSLGLDLALGVGGVPRGRIIEVYGPESSGKTTLALHILAEAQKKGGEVAFIDVEHALDPTYAEALGVDINNLLVSQPDTGEQAMEICEALVRSGAIDAIVVDSVAAMVVIVAFNKFASDTDEEMELLREHCEQLGVGFAINNAFSEGGEGAVDMARLVVDTIENNPSEPLRYTYKEEDNIQQKIEKVATNIYGASVITYSSIARNRIKLIEKMGITHYPVCIAKTQYSFSADPKIYGAVNNFEFHIKDIVINNGAEMIVAIAGEILRMPGLPKEPQALHIDIVDGEIEGLS